MTPIETLKRLAELQKKHRINANDSEYVAQIKKQFGYFKLNKEFESTDFAALADYVEGLELAAWHGWYEMNAIRARSGVPLDFDGRQQAICEQGWSDVVDQMKKALGDLAKPWPPEHAATIAECGE